MIRVFSNAPAELLSEILEAVREAEDPSGSSIETWQADENDNLRHTGENSRWLKQGSMKPVVKKCWIDFLFKPGVGKDPGAYGVLNGRLLTLLVNHFPADAQRIEFLDQRKLPQPS